MHSLHVNSEHRAVFSVEHKRNRGGDTFVSLRIFLNYSKTLQIFEGCKN
jgi:hypothetical protein